MPTPFWHSETAQEQLNRLDRPGLAFEFLRRNPDYRAEWRYIRQQIDQGQLDVQSARTALARRWGLSFCP
jgi:hypothetical protein